MPQIKEPTDEQSKIINDNGNLVVIAKPGSGKTFTIVEKINLISQTLYDYQGVIAISFTKKASDELEMRCKNRGAPRKQSFYGTIDSFYINQIIIPFSRHLTGCLTQFDIKTSVNDIVEYKVLSKIKDGYKPELIEMLLSALSKGYIFLDISGETALYILENVREAKEYLLAKYTHIFIDEYQDCGDIQHRIFMFLVNGGMTGVAVGDINQAIYAFSNRYPKYLTSLLLVPKFSPYEITRNHRCHKSISDYSLKLLGINTAVTEENKRVYKVNLIGDEDSIAKSIGAYLPAIKERYEVCNNNRVAILCRNNSTVQRVFNNIGLPCKLFQDTELNHINSYWARFFNDFLQCYYDPSVYNVDFVDRYFNEEANYLSYQKALKIIKELFDLKEHQLVDEMPNFIKLVKMVYPKYESTDVIDVFREILATDEKLKSYTPAKDEEINILSLHKSKGLEFDIVFHLDLYQWVMPPYQASKEDYEQSLNLHYVGLTRARKVCYIMQGTKRHNSAGELKQANESEFLSKNNLQDFRKDVSW